MPGDVPEQGQVVCSYRKRRGRENAAVHVAVASEMLHPVEDYVQARQHVGRDWSERRYRQVDVLNWVEG